MKHTVEQRRRWCRRFALAIAAAFALVAVVVAGPVTAFAESQGVATIGDTWYASIADAINHSEKGDTIVLQEDTTEDVDVNKDTRNIDFTIDLNGKTWITDTCHIRVGVAGANITVKNGVMALDQYGFYAFTLTRDVANGTFTFDQVAISGGDYGLYFAGNADYKLIDCNITAAGTAVEIRNGNLTIDGGTYTTESTDLRWWSPEDGTTTWGAAIGVSQHVNTVSNAWGPVTLTVNGGEFKGVASIYERNTTNDEASAKLELNDGIFTGQVLSNSRLEKFVNGGTYSEKLPAEYLAECMKMVEVDGSYVVKTEHATGDDAKLAWCEDGKSATAAFTCTSCGKTFSSKVTVGDGLVLTDTAVLDILASHELATKAIWNGSDLEISATVAPVKGTDEEAALVAGAINDGETVGQYVDVTLLLSTKDDSVGLSTTAEKAVVSIPVDELLTKTDENVERTFHVIRIHDGNAEYVDSTFVPEFGNLQVESELFSTYVVTYSDTDKTPVENEKDPIENEKDPVENEKDPADEDKTPVEDEKSPTDTDENPSDTTDKNSVKGDDTADKKETAASDKAAGAKVAPATAKKATPDTFDPSASMQLVGGMAAFGAMLAAGAVALRKR